MEVSGFVNIWQVQTAERLGLIDPYDGMTPDQLERHFTSLLEAKRGCVIDWGNGSTTEPDPRG